MQLAPSQVNKFIKHNYFTRKIKKNISTWFLLVVNTIVNTATAFIPIVEAKSSRPEDSKSIKTLQLLQKNPEKTEICFQKLCGINGHNIAVVLW